MTIDLGSAVLMISVTFPTLEAKIDALAAQVKTQGESIMAGIKDVNDAEATVHADLVTQNGLLGELLTAFASGAITPAQAQALVTQMNADDATAKSNIAAIQAALGTTPPAVPAA